MEEVKKEELPAVAEQPQPKKEEKPLPRREPRKLVEGREPRKGKRGGDFKLMEGRGKGVDIHGTVHAVCPRRKAGDEDQGSKKAAVEFSLDMLKPYFKKPLATVSKELGISATAIKKACRKLGIPKWPARTLTALKPKKKRADPLFSAVVSGGSGDVESSGAAGSDQDSGSAAGETDQESLDAARALAALKPKKKKAKVEKPREPVAEPAPVAAPAPVPEISRAPSDERSFDAALTLAAFLQPSSEVSASVPASALSAPVMSSLAAPAPIALPPSLPPLSALSRTEDTDGSKTINLPGGATAVCLPDGLAVLSQALGLRPPPAEANTTTAPETKEAADSSHAETKDGDVKAAEAAVSTESNSEPMKSAEAQDSTDSKECTDTQTSAASEGQHQAPASSAPTSTPAAVPTDAEVPLQHEPAAKSEGSTGNKEMHKSGPGRVDNGAVEEEQSDNKSCPPTQAQQDKTCSTEAVVSAQAEDIQSATATALMPQLAVGGVNLNALIGNVATGTGTTLTPEMAENALKKPVLEMTVEELQSGVVILTEKLSQSTQRIQDLQKIELEESVKRQQLQDHLDAISTRLNTIHQFMALSAGKMLGLRSTEAGNHNSDLFCATTSEDRSGTPSPPIGDGAASSSGTLSRVTSSEVTVGEDEALQQVLEQKNAVTKTQAVGQKKGGNGKPQQGLRKLVEGKPNPAVPKKTAAAQSNKKNTSSGQKHSKATTEEGRKVAPRKVGANQSHTQEREQEAEQSSNQVMEAKSSPLEAALPDLCNDNENASDASADRAHGFDEAISPQSGVSDATTAEHVVPDLHDHSEDASKSSLVKSPAKTKCKHGRPKMKCSECKASDNNVGEMVISDTADDLNEDGKRAAELDSERPKVKKLKTAELSGSEEESSPEKQKIEKLTKSIGLDPSQLPATPRRNRQQPTRLQH